MENLNAELEKLQEQRDYYIGPYSEISGLMSVEARVLLERYFVLKKWDFFNKQEKKLLKKIVKYFCD